MIWANMLLTFAVQEELLTGVEDLNHDHNGQRRQLNSDPACKPSFKVLVKRTRTNLVGTVPMLKL